MRFFLVDGAIVPVQTSLVLYVVTYQVHIFL